MRLVIDANIAQSAGISQVPDSRYSRECLNAVLEHRHIAVFSSPLRAEWRVHKSLHARRWWRSMMARKRIEYAEGSEYAQHLDPACGCLERKSWKDDLRKDFHLVQSALASDHIILSNERNLPGFVAIACRKVRVLSTLYYANPAVEREPCIGWIKAGAEKEAGRRIDVWADAHRTTD